MSISTQVIQKINSHLGITGRPRHISFDKGELIDTGCMEWSQSSSMADIFSKISPELKDAFQRLPEFLQQKTNNPSNKEIADFFSHESASLQAEFAEFNAKLLTTSSTNVKTPSLSELSPELKAASERIFDRLKEEQFLNGNEFDIDRYFARGRELLDEEPPSIQNELTEISLHIKEEAFSSSTRLDEGNNRCPKSKHYYKMIP